jgi:hypothetical protein
MDHVIVFHPIASIPPYAIEPAQHKGQVLIPPSKIRIKVSIHIQLIDDGSVG